MNTPEARLDGDTPTRKRIEEEDGLSTEETERLLDAGVTLASYGPGSPSKIV